ncbi:MAG: Gfo/Idh/MocA family oxidoreductase [Bacillota bacterium]
MKLIIKICNKLILAIKIRISLLRKRKKNEIIKWAIIGLGQMADKYAYSLNLSPNAKIVAVASRNINKAKKFANKHKVKQYYGSYMDMLKDNTLSIDIVYIATPVKLHYEHIKLCFDFNKNVICEKPITSNSAEFSELIEIARKKKLFFMEGMWLKTLPTFRKAIELIENKTIGDIKYLRIDLSKFDCLGLIKNEENLGVIYDYGIYPIAFAFGILKTQLYINQCYTYSSLSKEDLDWLISLKTNSTWVTINISSIFSGSKNAYVYGTKGFIVFPSQFNRTNQIVLYDAYGNLQSIYKYNYENDGFIYEIEEVNRCLKSGLIGSPIVSINESLQVSMLMEELMKIND